MLPQIYGAGSLPDFASSPLSKSEIVANVTKSTHAF